MVKRLSMLALAGLMVLPAVASAGGGKNKADLERKVEELSRQLDELKAQMAQQNEAISNYGDKVDDMDTMLEEKSEKWDLASRFQFDGDFRARGDYYSADSLIPGRDQENDTILTNRFRLNMRVKATEDLEFKGRLAMYKVWGSQSTPDGISGIDPIFDGNTSRTPNDSALYVDRAFVNWNNIGGAPVWFSIGRRPTSDGPPAQLRMNNDSRMATPVAYMDYPFDGLSLGYGYNWANDDLGSGRIRFCYGRGFENGLQDGSKTGIDDTDFAGFSWDVFQKGPRFLNLQAFEVFNLYNYPTFANEGVKQYYDINVGQKNLGNLYHTSGIFMDKFSNINYFIAGAWSHSDPNENRMFTTTDSEDGYSVYTGVRYDMDNLGLKIGAEYNYGSKYWLSFTPGHDDIYRSKLATRGNAYELYLIYDLPTGEAISKFAKTFVRLGWQYYDYNYFGSGDPNMYPYDLDNTNQAILQGLYNQNMNPIESANQVYLTFEAYF